MGIEKNTTRLIDAEEARAKPNVHLFSWDSVMYMCVYVCTPGSRM